MDSRQQLGRRLGVVGEKCHAMAIPVVHHNCDSPESLTFASGSAQEFLLRRGLTLAFTE